MTTASPRNAGTEPRIARALDHLVLPVAELDQARARLKALGFTVAADASHPFGTENCCVYFADGTYLEPLAVDKRETCEAAALKGNVFVARDQAYRFRKGQDGFSALAFASDDAKADRDRFARAGISAGRLLRFSRAFEDGQGKREKMDFRLAFAADLRAPDAYFFTCERAGRAAPARSLLETHENGVVAIREAAMCEANPADFQYLLEEVVNTRKINAHSFGIELAAANANIAAYTPAGMKAWFGDAGCGHGRGLKLRAMVLAVADLGRTRALFEARRIAYRNIAGRLVVAPAPGQGATLAFEAEKDNGK